ncbi:alpha/beta hydrolase [Alteromonas mediterranea]|uniref:alpha/beta fold hydrolase n=1 Tax=Alteromonas mediterranea TaxID=314275 RepID=UPI00090340AE|nr:alpha/beta hydrolase [Alteromonas mediterranea]APD92742.1 alpha/beta hydrolase [Alteromonas mediterranea]APD96356.1 alpha/beta hydrolase [Alteromonas mediterranea]APE00613.1 alpha/beta hydrolase [Alteromonas mediterranea]QDG37115.1 alpha/beta hydrolase [Alteromonas mediterranea]QGX60407.1 alpha/beta fold hydrolase [Alteromonas mediterranea]
MSVQHPVLFFPGTLCDERIFLPLWRQLNIAQRRYVPLQWASSQEEMLALSEDRILDNEKVHLVGYSMGGFIASLVAQRNPHNIASVTLIGYNPEGLSKEEIAKRKQLTTMLKQGNFKPDNDAYLSRFIHPSRLNDDKVAGVVKSMAQDLGTTTLLNHTLATTPRESTVKALAKINAPTTLIAAQQDAIAPAAAIAQLKAQLPKANFQVIENAGHMMVLEQTDAVASIIAKQIGV